MKEAHKRSGRRLLLPLTKLLARAGLTATGVTLFALPLALGAGYLFATGRFIWAGVVLALVGLCDTLDGELSRLTGTTSPRGAFLDSVVDRVGESATFVGIAWYFAWQEPLQAMLAVGALLLSLLVSYVRARAEGVGYDCRVGWFERPTRFLILLFGTFVLGRTWLWVALAVIAGGSLVTVVHRTIHVLRQGKRA